MLEYIYNKLWFIIAFLILCLVITMTAGEKPLKYFLGLILMGSILLNADTFISTISKAFKE